MKRIAPSCLFLACLLTGTAALAVDGANDQAATASSADRRGMVTPARTESPSSADRTFAALPLSFERSSDKTGGNVRFLSRGNAYHLYLMSTEAVIAFPRVTFEMRLLGSKKYPRIEGLQPLPGNINYFTGNEPGQWRTGIPTYGRVAMRGVYPGIDLIYYGNQQQLEYDFQVAAGADPRRIRLQIAGASNLSIAREGDLVLHTDTGDLRLLAPRIWQEIDGQRRSISGGWQIEPPFIATLKIGDYDRSRALVIDPVMVYSSFLGGTQANSLRKIAVDAAGNAYVAGFTAPGDFPASPTPQAMTFGGGSASRGAFVAKIDPAGKNLLFTTYLSGSADEEAAALALDPSGNILVAGTTHSSDFPVRNAFQSTCAIQASTHLCATAFLAKLSATGDALLFSTYLGGNGGDSATALAVDSNGAAYVVGATSSKDFPATKGSIQPTCGGACAQNAFLAKFNPDESQSFATYLGGSGSDTPADIALDSAGNTYITGETTSADFPVANAFQKTCAIDAGSSAGTCVATAFITKIKSDGSALAYSTYLGGTLGSKAAGIAVDSLGRAYVAGSTQSPDFPVVNALQKKCALDGSSGQCSVDAFVTKFDPTGKSLVYSTYLGGAGHDEAAGIAVDATGRAHVVGYTESPDFPTMKPVQPHLSGSSDAFVARLNPGGSALEFSTFHGGSSTEAGNTLALDAKGSVYFAGQTASQDFPTSHPFQSSCAGACANSFVTKLVALPPPPAAQTVIKSFSAATIPLNGTTTLTIAITNPNASGLTGVIFTDSLPAGMAVAATPNVTNSCNGTTTATAGASSITLAAGTIAASGSCSVAVDVTASTAGVDNNSVTVSSNEGGTSPAANASITVVSPPAFSKAFGAGSIPVGGSTSLSFTITNNNTTTGLTGVAFTDTLPAGLVVSTPNGLTGTCGGGTITAIAGSGSVSLSGASIAASGSCTFSVNVNGSTAGTQNNTTGAVTSTEGGTGGTANASVVVIAPPSIAKAFGASNIAVNGTTSLTLTITNSNPVALAGVAVTDALPAGMTVATPNGLANACGGTATATAGSSSLSLTGGGIAGSGNCTLTINVTVASSGSFTNTTGNVSSTNGGTGNTGTASLTSLSAPSITKSFGVATIPLNGSTSLTFTLTNPNTATSLTGVAFTDSLPAGLVVATPNALANTCGGTATAVAGSSSVSLASATLAGNASCTLSVNVTGTTGGVQNNSVTVNSTNGGTGNTSNASVTVVSPPTLSKAFGAASIPFNGTTSLTFTVSNPSTTATVNGIAFSDTLPAGLVISTPNGLAGSCGGGTITATQATNIVSLSGATLAASASCNFSVNVNGIAAGAQNNTTSTITSTNGGTGTAASASLAVVAPPAIAKSFNPTLIALNATSSLTFTITNPAANSVASAGVAFTDTLPTGLTVSSGTTTVCGGTLTTTSPTGISLTGATVSLGATCQFSVTVTGAASGNYTNTTGNVSSTNGGTGNTASASITVGNPPTLTKAFGAAAVTLNATTSLTFTVTNPNNGIALAGVAFSDTLPAGLVIASPNGLSGSCAGGTITAAAGSASVSLAGAALAASASCTFAVNVTGITAGVQNNTTGAVSSTTTGAGGTASASVTVQDYSIALAPSSLTVIQGSTSSPSTLTATPLFGYAGTVTPAATTCTPAGFSCSFTNITLPGTGAGNSGSSSVSVMVAAATAPGNYTGAFTVTDSSTPAISHNVPISFAVVCTFSLINPTYTPQTTTAPTSFGFTVNETAGGTSCPWTAAASGSSITLTAPTSGTDTAAGTGLPVAYTVGPNSTTAQTGTITVTYFGGSSALQVTQEPTVTAPNTIAGSSATVTLPVSQTGAGAASITFISTCGAVNASNLPDPANNNFGITCSASTTPLPTTGVTLTVNIPLGATADLRQIPRGPRTLAPLYAWALGMPGIVFLGLGAAALGPQRKKTARRGTVRLFCILLIVSLVALISSCGSNGFNATVVPKGNANSFTVTVMGVVSDSSGNVTGVEIYTVSVPVTPQV